MAAHQRLRRSFQEKWPYKSPQTPKTNPKLKSESKHWKNSDQLPYGSSCTFPMEVLEVWFGRYDIPSQEFGSIGLLFSLFWLGGDGHQHCPLESSKVPPWAATISTCHGKGYLGFAKPHMMLEVERTMIPIGNLHREYIMHILYRSLSLSLSPSIAFNTYSALFGGTSSTSKNTLRSTHSKLENPRTKWRFIAGRISYKLRNFHWHVCLPEGRWYRPSGNQTWQYTI